MCAEGCLAVTIRLAPLLPTRVAVAQFPNVESAVKASTEILNYGINLRKPFPYFFLTPT